MITGKVDLDMYADISSFWTGLERSGCAISSAMGVTVFDWHVTGISSTGRKQIDAAYSKSGRPKHAFRILRVTSDTCRHRCTLDPALEVKLGQVSEVLKPIHGRWSLSAAAASSPLSRK